jgi:imidazolonepropionase-like amidohydrolase
LVDKPVWLHVGTLLDGTSTRPARDVHVVYNAAEILFVGADGRTPSAETVREGQRAPDFSTPDATLLPGLIEAHAHLFLEGGELDMDRRAAHLQRSPVELLSAARERLPKLVRLGIAGVRDAGDKNGVGLALSKWYKNRDTKVGQVFDLPSDGAKSRPDAESLFSPYYESPGAAIHHRGRYGGFMADALENFSSAQACVEARIAAGADRIKLIPTGIINFQKGAVTSEPQMTTEEVAAIVTAAKSLQRQTFAHASGDIGIDRAIDGGVDSIEHGFFLRDDQLAKLRDRQIAWVPTFAPVRAQVKYASIVGWDTEIVANLQRILDQHAKTLVKAHELGVTIIAGSDAGSYGVPHGTGLLDELELMELAGLPAIAVINAATGASAGRLKYQEKIGRVAVGYASRFILAPHSPFETVANLRRQRSVVFDGVNFDTTEPADVTGL